MTTAALYALLAFAIAGFASILAGLAVLHVAWWERRR